MTKSSWEEWSESEDAQKLRDLFEAQKKYNDECAEKFWEGLSYDDKCNAFHAVVKRIFDGEIKVKGSYRYVLYDVFGFAPEMYTRGMDCGYMALHNSIMDDVKVNIGEESDETKSD